MPRRRDDLDVRLEQLTAARCIFGRARVAPVRMHGERGDQAGEIRHADPAGVEPRARLARDERTRQLVRLLREVRRRTHADQLRVAHVECAGRIGGAQPLLRRHRVEVELADVDLDRARRLRTVDEERQTALVAQAMHVEPAARRPEHVRRRDQARTRCYRREHRVLVRLDDHDAGAGRVQRTRQAEVLLVGRDHLVFCGETEPREHDGAATRRRLDERDADRLDAQHVGEAATRHLAQLEHALEVLLAAAAFDEIALHLLDDRVGCRARERAVRARVEIRVALEHRKLCACLLERHPTVSSTGA